MSYNPSLEQICSDFQRAWNRSDGRISIDAWVKRAPQELQAQIFPHLLMVEKTLRAQQDAALSSITWSRLSQLGKPILQSDDAETSVLSRADDQNAPLDLSSPDPETLRKALLRCSTLRGLSAETMAALETHLQVRQFAGGETILKQNGPAQGLFVILHGELEIYKQDNPEKQEDTANCLIGVAGIGALLGEMSLLTGQNCLATVRTASEVSALVLPAESYLQLREQFPELEIAISQLVSDRLGSRKIDSLCGRTIGKYLPCRCISSGGMGVVYEARSAESADEPSVALKMLRHRFVSDPRSVAQFQREGELLTRLRHPNVLAVQDCFLAYNTRFLVMELCDGLDLSKLLMEYGPMPEFMVREILGQIVNGLHFIHAQGIVHLDLKPSNILVRRDGTVKIADFGISQIMEPEPAEAVLCGTPVYMPPEQISGMQVGQAADWYALGCLTFELLTNQKLFLAENMVELLLLKSLSQPSATWPRLVVSDELRDVLAGMLQVAPQDRRVDIERLALWANPVPELFCDAWD